MSGKIDVFLFFQPKIPLPHDQTRVVVYLIISHKKKKLKYKNYYF